MCLINIISADAEAIEDVYQLKKKGREHDMHWESANWWDRDTLLAISFAM
jgi:hypothetical protein